MQGRFTFRTKYDNTRFQLFALGKFVKKAATKLVQRQALRHRFPLPPQIKNIADNPVKPPDVVADDAQQALSQGIAALLAQQFPGMRD